MLYVLLSYKSRYVLYALNLFLAPSFMFVFETIFVVCLILPSGVRAKFLQSLEMVTFFPANENAADTLYMST